MITAAALAVAGCGKKEQSTSGMDTPGAPQPQPLPADNSTSPKEGRAVEITANDTMKFSITEIRAKPGEALSVTLRNVGTMPKFSMGHNWIVVKTAADVDPFIADAPQAATTDYIPEQHKSKIIVHTKLLGPKESDTVSFKAPDQPGRYPFFCSFPGHYQVGMKGELIVE